MSEAGVKSEPAAKPDHGALLEFMFRLGQAYLAAGEQTALVELFLRRVAASRRMRRARVIAFPTALFISVHDGEREVTSLCEGPQRSLRLDQIGAVYTLGARAQRGEVEPAEGLEQLNEIMRRPPRFAPWARVFGHVLFTVGLAMVLMPTAANIAAAAVLGLIVGVLKAVADDRRVLDAPLSAVAAALVAALVFLAMKYGLPVDPVHALVPPLVTFLPGAMLTFAMIELAYGDMVSGASRLVSGMVQLVLLAFGLAVGAALVGYTPADLVTAAAGADSSLIPGAGLVGILVFGVGVSLHSSAPKNALVWVLVALLVTAAAQAAAGAQFGGQVSGFFGMLVATPLSFLIQMRFKGPPAMVTFLPCFWMLVPGSVSLLSVKRMMTDYALGMEELVGATFVFASLALGTLVGASAYKLVTESLGLRDLRMGQPPRPVAKPAEDAAKAGAASPPSGTGQNG
jgi:uncharacterized membrane protein YjjP (DUF1212 family)